MFYGKDEYKYEIKKDREKIRGGKAEITSEKEIED